MKVLVRGKRQTAISAHQQGLLTLSWQKDDPKLLRNIAGKYDWPMPPPGFASWLMDVVSHLKWRSPIDRLNDAFLSKMFESDENWDLAVASMGMDVYVPDSWRD